MGGVVDEAFAAALRRNRDHLNARFAYARRFDGAIDATSFATFLSDCVAPVVAQTATLGVTEGELDRLTLELYDAALALIAAEYAGPGERYPIVSRMWRELLVPIARLLAPPTRGVVAALSNAVINLSVEPGVDAQRWLDRMLDLQRHVTTIDELLRVGEVLAWQCGMAHYRESARRVARKLRPELAAVVAGDIDLDEQWPRGEGAALRIVGVVGDFIGFGGAFESPPEVVQSDGALYAFDRHACWSVHADRFGAVLKRSSRKPPTAPPRDARYVSTSSAIRLHGVDGTFALAPRTRGVACSDEMALVVTDHSHRISIVARAIE